jgi:glycosyltransferase involved in cell wall biosynthesis
VTRLAERHDLAVLHLREPGAEGADDAVRDACAHVEEFRVPSHSGVIRKAHSLVGLGLGRPRWVSHLTAMGFGRRFRRLVAEWQPDVIQLEFHVMGQYVRFLPRQRPPVVLVEHDPGAATALEQHELHPGHGWRRLVSRADVTAWERYERRVLSRVDALVVFTEDDRHSVMRSAPIALPIETIPFGISPLPVAGGRERADTVLFVGSFIHPPNVDAAMRLVQGIHPRLRELRPEARLVIVGENPPDALREAAGEGVEVTGRVPEVAPYVAESAVVLIPVRLGGGMRVKTQEALAAGKAIVSSTRALAGLAVRDGDHVVVAESDEEFAARAADLLGDADRRAALGHAARAWAETHLGWDTTVGRYEELYARLLRAAQAPVVVAAQAGGDAG